VVGSMAIPGLFRPVLFGEGVLIDGGAMNPLPYDRLKTVPGASFAPRINSQPLMTIFPDRCP
jgi:NTE family protein